MIIRNSNGDNTNKATVKLIKELQLVREAENELPFSAEDLMKQMESVILENVICRTKLYIKEIKISSYINLIFLSNVKSANFLAFS